MQDDITFADVLDYVRQADRDEITRLFAEGNARAKVLLAQRRRDMVAQLKVGNTVQLRDIRPKYLNGALGTVEGIEGDNKVVVRFDPDERRAIQRFGPNVRVGASALELVEADDSDLQEAAAAAGMAAIERGADDDEVDRAAVDAAALALENRGRS